MNTTVNINISFTGIQTFLCHVVRNRSLSLGLTNVGAELLSFICHFIAYQEMIRLEVSLGGKEIAGEGQLWEMERKRAQE